MQLKPVNKYIIALKDLIFGWPKVATPTISIKKLNINYGEHLLIKGPSGCGKSTLLGLLSGIHLPSKGSIRVLEQELTQLNTSERDLFRADHIGYIFQQFNLLPYLNIIDNVLLPCYFSINRKQNINNQLEDHARSILSKLQLPASLFGKSVLELSIGQQQRVAAARALIGNPELIIADEPTSALDYDNCDAFMELLLEQTSHANATLVFVSHDANLEKHFNRILNFNDIHKVKS